MSSPIALVVAVTLLGVNAFFVAGEFALLAARRSRLETLASDGDARAGGALRAISELSVMLAGAQLGITMASLALGAIAEPAIAHGLEGLLQRTDLPEGAVEAIGFGTALAVVVFLHMVVGEMIPKSWAITDPERSALLLVRPFRAFVVAFRPFIALLNAAANGVVRLFGVEPRAELAAAHSPADLLFLLRGRAEEGGGPDDGTAMLTRALERTGLDAESVMIPRRSIVAVPADAAVDELERIASESGRSRLVVYQGDLDDVVGILHVKDLLAVDARDRDRLTARRLARAALVTPESRRIEDLTLDMRQRRQHVALVVDEFGSVTGLVALEDVLEELIGEFEDETDRLRRRLRRRPDGRIVVPGTLRPDELEDQTGVTLPPGPYETVAGFVVRTLDRLPLEGEVVPLGGLELQVVRMEGHRIAELALRPAADDGAGPPPPA